MFGFLLGLATVFAASEAVTDVSIQIPPDMTVHTKSEQSTETFFPGRRTTLFNRDFRFSIGSHHDAKWIAFDDSKWERVGVPHSFSIPYFRSPEFYVGEGWYRKTFTLPQKTVDRFYRLDFEAVFQHCDIYVNEKLAGSHKGGYTGFSIDITPFLKSGENLVTIRVDNKWDPVLPPRAGEHVFSGGIYRDVRLVETGAVYIPHNGFRVSTPNVSDHESKVKVTAWIKNGAPLTRNVDIEVKIFDEKGTTVAKGVYEKQLVGGETLKFETPLLTVKETNLWHPDHPYLYRAELTLLESEDLKIKKRTDAVGSRFGIRSFVFKADKGFFLNGQRLWLRGANRHQDHAGWGDAVTNAGHYRDAKLIKDCGMNFVRGSHYPHDPAFLDACDELGLLFWSENAFWGIGGFGKDGYWNCSAYPEREEDQAEFEENNHRLLAEMICDAYNHPSVIVWSMCNEPFFSASKVMDKARRHVKSLMEYTERLDPTRPPGVGGAQRGDFDKLGGIIGYNGDGARFGNPMSPSLVSEYGSHVANRPGIYDPTFGEAVGQHQPWRSGIALWCAFHHGSIAGDMGRMGMIDYFRLPLRQWYWYREDYAKVPPPEWVKPGKPAALKLFADKLDLRNDGTDDIFLRVAVVDAEGKRIDNNPNVTLEIISGPGEFPTGPSITFSHNTDIDIREGLAAIAFRSWHGGATVIRATSPDLEEDTIEIVTEGFPLWKPEYAVDFQKKRIYSKNPGWRENKPEQRDNLAYIRPTRVSSEESKNPADKANDGDASTRWCAADGSIPAWWQVDLENFYTVDSVMIQLEQSGVFEYRIEGSADNDNWVLLAECGPDDPTTAARTHPAEPHDPVRFLRVTFTAVPSDVWPGICEIKVSGKSAAK